MMNIKEDTTLVGVAELRTNAVNIIKETKNHKVVLTKRNKPICVIVDYDKYEKMEKMFDYFEDVVLSSIVKERLKRKNKQMLTLEEAERKVGLY
jgi:prevent-host-death family protein